MTEGKRGTEALVAAIRDAVASVDDPEMPGVSITDLGLLESVEVDDHGCVTIGLIPTFSGCPALDLIAERVRAAVSAIDAVGAIHVTFLRAPAWSIDRVNALAQHALADRLGIAVERGGIATCPRCGGSTEERSMFGPTRCRAVHVCTACGEAVEVLR